MPETALELRDLHKRYGETTALDGVSFAVGRGEMFGFAGPTGRARRPRWELAVSLALMVVAIYLVVRLAGRIYERSVLRFGTPVKLREALGAGKLSGRPLYGR